MTGHLLGLYTLAVPNACIKRNGKLEERIPGQESSKLDKINTRNRSIETCDCKAGRGEGYRAARLSTETGFLWELLS